jgi:hypothetical protein
MCCIVPELTHIFVLSMNKNGKSARRKGNINIHSTLTRTTCGLTVF